MPPRLVEAVHITKTFGSLRAVDDVSVAIHPGTVHALVGENGAGKSPLVQCILGFYHADSGDVRVDGARHSVRTPADARRHGIGMVFQHFTLIPSMTVAENLILARADIPAVIDWKTEKTKIREFLERAPFPIDIEARVEHLAVGQKQKVEILKQLFLKTQVLILDEPTSVLTPVEAGEVLGVLRTMAREARITVVLITHKLREVMEYADEVTVLRRGKQVASAVVKDVTSTRIAEWMVGDSRPPRNQEKSGSAVGAVAFELRGLTVMGDLGTPAVRGVNLSVRKGEILGVAGVSGNGQRELIQTIGGQRPIESGEILAEGKVFLPSRGQLREAGLFTLPEEPLQNATVPAMSVAENLGLRVYDREPFSSGGIWLHPSRLREWAAEVIQRFSIRTPSPDTPMRDLSGGNVQRAVLARDLYNGEVKILVVANPCFGLDFGATAFARNHLVELRNRGGGVLLVSEDLDELLELSDRIVVMSAGSIVYETNRADVDMATLGSHMGGHV